MSKTIAVTGASSGFGALTVRELANAGHTVYAGLRDVAGHNSDAAEEVHQYAAEHDVALRAIELDVSSQDNVDEAVALIIDEQGQLDVIVHNAGHMVVGPAEAFTVDQLIEMYDVNVLSTQGLNRAAFSAPPALGSVPEVGQRARRGLGRLDRGRVRGTGNADPLRAQPQRHVLLDRRVPGVVILAVDHQ
jgi:NAD(P)-dependent dehydrogenase (short-subunit alcohol dehydrogenase family)